MHIRFSLTRDSDKTETKNSVTHTLYPKIIDISVHSSVSCHYEGWGELHRRGLVIST